MKGWTCGWRGVWTWRRDGAMPEGSTMHRPSNTPNVQPPNVQPPNVQTPNVQTPKRRTSKRRTSIVQTVPYSVRSVVAGSMRVAR